MQAAELPWVAALIPVALVLWRVSGGRLRSTRWDDLVKRGEMLLLAGLVLGLGAFAARNVIEPEPWDFPVFYTVSRNAVDGSSVYAEDELLATFAEVRAEADVPPDWLGEFGFWYLPPTSLILAPLGFFPYRTALVLHYLVEGALLVGSAVLLHRRIPLGSGRTGPVRMGILFCAFRPVGSAVALAQIVFGALFFEAWALTRADDDERVGVAAGLGFAFKHLMVIPVVLLYLAGRRRALTWATATVGLLGVASAILLGPGSYAEFVSGGPSNRKPELALAGVNQSLNATLRRIFDDVPTSAGAAAAVLHPPFLLASAAITAITVGALVRARRRSGPAVLDLALATLAGLILYPNTLFSTIALVVPVMTIILAPFSGFDQRSVSERRIIVGVIGATYALSSVLLEHAFWGMFALWVVLVALLARSGRPEAAAAPGAGPSRTSRVPVASE